MSERDELTGLIMRLRYDDCDEGCVLRGQQSEVVAMQDVTSQAPRAVIDVPVLDLYADPNQPRRNFPAAALRELADSIAVRITHPLVVRPRAGGGYWIVDGERRWRAAALLGRPALPCLVDTIDDPLEVAAVQITTSAQREQLSAVEVAEFLAELRDRRQLSHNELAAELAKLGLQKFGAMKLEKLVKLADLPRWAKKLSQDGALSDSLAGSLVAWSTHRSFMDALGSELQAAAALTGQITAGELQETIRRVLEAVGVDLNARHPAELVRRFPLERCRGQCACYHRFQKADWCVHRERFLARNAEAQEASTVPAADEPAPDARDNPDPTAVPPLGVQVTVAGLVALSSVNHPTQALAFARFDLDQCAGCPHQHLASLSGMNPETAQHYCFHVPCFEAKQLQAKRTRNLDERLRLLLDQWLRATLTDHAATLFPQGSCSRAIVIYWLATGAVDRASDYLPGQMHAEAARVTRALLLARQIRSLPALAEYVETAAAEDRETLELDLCQAAIATMTPDQLRWLAQHEGSRITGDQTIPLITHYRIDQAFVRALRRSQLLEVLQAAGVTAHTRSIGELRATALQPAVVAAIGCPPAMAALFAEPPSMTPAFAADLDGAAAAALATQDTEDAAVDE